MASCDSDSDIEIIYGPRPVRSAAPANSCQVVRHSSQARNYQEQALNEPHIKKAEDQRIFCGLCDVWVPLTSQSDWWACWKRHCSTLDHLQVLDRLAFESNMANMENERRIRMDKWASVSSESDSNFPGVRDILAGNMFVLLTYISALLIHPLSPPPRQPPLPISKMDSSHSELQTRSLCAVTLQALCFQRTEVNTDTLQFTFSTSHTHASLCPRTIQRGFFF